MSRYDPARDCFTTDPPPAPASDGAQHSPPAATPAEPAAPADAHSSPRDAGSPREAAPSAGAASPSSPSRKRKLPPATGPPSDPSAKVPLSAANLPKIKRRKASDAPARPPPDRYRYRSPPPPLLQAPREPSPLPASSRESSPPRKRKKPTTRLRPEERQAAQETARRREQEEAARAPAASTGVEDVVRSHYNDKKELGKTWRKTDSKIRGLRSFNNWVKSTLIQKFSPAEDFDPRRPFDHKPLTVLDMGCGKGGDLLKWKSAPQEVGLYVGVDTADVSIAHAHDRYDSMMRDERRRRSARRPFDAEFHAMDCWTRWIGEIPIVDRVGADPNVGPGAQRLAARWGGGGFDVVSMMFCMHYAFESEAKCRRMLGNVAGALARGGRFIGTIPSSDVIGARVRGEDARDTLPAGDDAHGVQGWGNGIYQVRFAEPPPRSGVFRPPWGWKYNFFLEEAVEEVPEYVVPWEAFRAMAEDYNLELVYKRLFHDVWKEEKDDRELSTLAERMGVRDREGRFKIGDEEWEACGFYMAFAFRKI